LIKNTICLLKDAEPARMILTQLNKKSYKKIQLVKGEEEKRMAKVLILTEENQIIDKKV